MLQKLLTACGTILIVVFIAWAVVNAAVGMKAPDIASQTWLNSTPLHLADLKGKVVMVEFWTFGCYNCRNVEPSVNPHYS
jgi:thiol-disulfide isomerase/thioredoxin